MPSGWPSGRPCRRARRSRPRSRPHASASGTKAQPRWTAAACTAAPAATSSSSAGTWTVRPVEVGHHAPVGRAAGCAPDQEHPSGRYRRPERVDAAEEVADHALDGGPGQRAPASRRSASPKGCRWRPVGSVSARRRDAARARGRPLRRAPRGPVASNCAWSSPSSRATASVTLVAFMVHTSGRKRPVASANPATVPVGSRRRLGRSR